MDDDEDDDSEGVLTIVLIWALLDLHMLSTSFIENPIIEHLEEALISVFTNHRRMSPLLNTLFFVSSLCMCFYLMRKSLL